MAGLPQPPVWNLSTVARVSLCQERVYHAPLVSVSSLNQALTQTTRTPRRLRRLILLTYRRLPSWARTNFSQVVYSLVETPPELQETRFCQRLSVALGETCAGFSILQILHHLPRLPWFALALLSWRRIDLWDTLVGILPPSHNDLLPLIHCNARTRPVSPASEEEGDHEDAGSPAPLLPPVVLRPLIAPYPRDLPHPAFPRTPPPALDDLPVPATPQQAALRALPRHLFLSLPSEAGSNPPSPASSESL